MAYDLLIRNGRIVDGSGMPAFRGDLAVKDGKIVEIGKINGSATRTIDADGLAVSPGFIDNHCHYDAQVTWDATLSPLRRRRGSPRRTMGRMLMVGEYTQQPPAPRRATGGRRCGGPAG